LIKIKNEIIKIYKLIPMLATTIYEVTEPFLLRVWLCILYDCWIG